MADDPSNVIEQEIVKTQQDPSSLLDEVIAETGLRPGEAGYEVTRRGMVDLIEGIIKPESDSKSTRIDKFVVDQMITELDSKLGVQLDEILHHPKVQEMEAAWTGCKYVIDHADFRENIKVNLLNVSKQDLINDFEDAPEIVNSGYYKTVYSAEYGVFGGSPIGAVIANYDFGPSAPDIKLLQRVASVSAMAHAPFIAAASPKYFGHDDDFQGLPKLKDLDAHFEQPQYINWNAFRESEDARCVALTCPRFLLRLPYDPEDNPVKSLDYRERVSASHQHYLWGNTAFAFATRLADSFAKYRWCANIIGPRNGGLVEDLHLHQFESMGEIETKIPTEVLLTERREFELSEQGFIGLTMRKGSNNAAFFSANSVQKPKYFGNSPEDKDAETNYKLGTQLPYMFIMNRLAHYIKVLQREHIGDWKERSDLQRELNDWIRQYIADSDNPPASVRSKRPLRKADIKVSSVEGDPGWYHVELKVRPGFKYMGAYFDLSLVGKLDQE